MILFREEGGKRLIRQDYGKGELFFEGEVVTFLWLAVISLADDKPLR